MHTAYFNSRNSSIFFTIFHHYLHVQITLPASYSATPLLLDFVSLISNTNSHSLSYYSSEGLTYCRYVYRFKYSVLPLYFIFSYNRAVYCVIYWSCVLYFIRFYNSWSFSHTYKIDTQTYLLLFSAILSWTLYIYNPVFHFCMSYSTSSSQFCIIASLLPARGLLRTHYDSFPMSPLRSFCTFNSCDCLRFVFKLLVY